MKRSYIKLISAIDIGSNYIRMCIGEVFQDGEIVIIEDLVKSTNIGRDTFSRGKISVETINETCEILKGFSHILKEYRIKDYTAVSTTGMREAENQEYVIEQIKIKSGLEMRIINSAEEKFYMYKALKGQASYLKLMYSKPTMIVNITSGGVEISAYNSGKLKSTEYIKIGSLRLREQLSNLESVTSDFPVIMEELIESKIYFLKETILDMNIHHFIGLGGELNTIYSLCYPHKDASDHDIFIERERLEDLYNKIIKMSRDQIIEEYGISKKEEEILIPSIIFFKVFLEYTKAKGIYVPRISLRQGILHHMSEEALKELNDVNSNEDILKSALYINSKYCTDGKHASYVRMLALSIFDQTYKIHKLDSRERLYLEVAALLHDIGKHISHSDHNLHSYYIIKAQNITGLSHRELEIVANIARYHEGDIPSHSHENYYSLDFRERILVSKLSAILQIAESMDVSHKQKISKVDISLVPRDKIYFAPITKHNILLEEWYFNNTVDFFEEVFGLRPTIKHKG